MKRIFYFTGHRLTALHWSGKAFTGACSFEPDQEGFLKFEQYLKSAVNVKAKLLVDVIEEDFRIETIPHVYGKDKEAVISRILDRYYRMSHDFTYAETLWRQKAGRKDDEVLMGAITNPQLIEPWLRIITECETPLSGIWTLPLVSKDMLPLIKAKSRSVLLVSQQVSSNLRQSFFKNKKLISSRTSVINMEDNQQSSLGERAEPEIARTLSYLRSQGHIDKAEIVEIHVLASTEQIASYKEHLVTNEQQKNYIHDIASIQQIAGLSNLNDRLSDGLFAWLCLKSKKAQGHYGKAKEFKQYYYSLASTALYVTSIITLLFSILTTESSISEAMQYTKSIELLGQQEDKFRQTYDSKFKEFESVLENAKVMSASVDLANQIKKGSKVNPLDFFIEISNTLSSSKLGDISIDAITWSTEQLIAKKGRKKKSKASPVLVKTNLALDYPVQHVAILKGRIQIPSDNYRASVKQIEAIVTALKGNPRIKSVKTLEVPVEVRPEKKFSDDSGVSAALTKRESNEGLFVLEIKMKAHDDA